MAPPRKRRSSVVGSDHPLAGTMWDGRLVDRFYESMEQGAMAIKIDRDIPRPRPAIRSDLFPLEKMQVGDSFAVPTQLKIHQCRGIIHRYGLRSKEGKKFSVMWNGNGYRCWRIK